MIKEKLSDAEFNAVLALTSATKLDTGFDLHDFGDYDAFIDYDDNDSVHDIKWGLECIYDGLGYPLEHDVSEEEAKIIKGLFQRYGIPYGD